MIVESRMSFASGRTPLEYRCRVGFAPANGADLNPHIWQYDAHYTEVD